MEDKREQLVQRKSDLPQYLSSIEWVPGTGPAEGSILQVADYLFSEPCLLVILRFAFTHHEAIITIPLISPQHKDTQKCESKISGIRHLANVRVRSTWQT